MKNLYFLTLLFLTFFTATAQPKPGDVFRDYTWLSIMVVESENFDWKDTSFPGSDGPWYGRTVAKNYDESKVDRIAKLSINKFDQEILPIPKLILHQISFLLFED